MKSCFQNEMTLRVNLGFLKIRRGKKNIFIAQSERGNTNIISASRHHSHCLFVRGLAQVPSGKASLPAISWLTVTLC